MSVNVKDVSSPVSEGQSSVLEVGEKESEVTSKENVEEGQCSEPSTPKPHPMAFTVDFGEAKRYDNRRLEELAKKSQARHQRVQSMSASAPKPSPISQRMSMSAKLPRKAQGYNSEGYFSSDQEDGLSSSLKFRSSPLAQTDNSIQRQVKSPVEFQPKRTSKSPIVDSIMSRSENFSTRPTLNLPLKISSYGDVQKSPSYSNLNFFRHPMTDILDQSPDGVMLVDISSPELDILTPDNGLSTPELSRSPVSHKFRASSETPDLFKKCPPKPQVLFIDDEDDRQSNNSSTGTYTIEGDNYTEEQKARMSIDRTFGTDLFKHTIDETLKRKNLENDPELIFDFSKPIITAEPRHDLCLHNALPITKKEPHSMVSKDKNVLEISCCYESPSESVLAAQTSKQIKSTRSYLEKIKNRVRTITEKTFSKSPPRYGDGDFGMFTSVTTSGVLSSKYPVNVEIPVRRRCSLTKSEIDKTDYIHRLSRESSVPVSLPSTKNVLEDAKFESTALRNAQKAMREENPDLTPEEIVNRLSYLSLNRCKGDKTWIQHWADSVQNYNTNTLGKEAGDLNSTFMLEDRPPISPRLHPTKSRSPHGGTPTKIPSPVGTLLHRRTPDLIPPQDTESYLLKTQNAITNLQAKLNSSRNTNIPSQLTTSLISEKTLVSRLPLAQLSRSNSLNYRLRRKDNSGDGSPLRSPGHYVITGSSKVDHRRLNNPSRSLDTEPRRDSNMNSPDSHRGLLSNSSDDKTLSNRPTMSSKAHTRHKSFDGRTDYKDINTNVCLKAVLKNNALDTNFRIDQTRQPPNVIKRSSSFNTVKNNNLIDTRKISRRLSGHSDISDDTDNGSFDKDLRKRVFSPELTTVPSNSPRCPNTPEMQRKFGPGLVRNTRVTSKGRMSEPPMARKPTNHQSRQDSKVMNRQTKSRSSTREPPKSDKAQKKPNQHRSSSALATKEKEFTNWKKRSSYDPMKAAQEGKKKQQMAKRQECNKDDLSSPSHSSPVHRSQSFHTTNMADLTLDYSSEGTEDDQPTLPIDPMITSTHSDILDLRRKGLTNDVILGRSYVANFKVTQPEKPKRHDKHKTGKEVDKRRTFILDSDTNSTTNGSSPRNSSIFSHEKNSYTDTEGESGTESAPVMRQNMTQVQPKQRYSGDYSMSSSTTSIGHKKPKEIQPRYMDISKYKAENSPKTFLRRDPSKTYVGVLNERPVSKGSAQHYEMEQKKQELEKWKRRASYDPRKAAALGKSKTPPKTASNVLRSQSFHGPVLSPNLRYQPSPAQINESYDASSDNDF
ncbi:uncharacterized protein LOC123717527 isoform X1 [Pieris brassicae]|uniref:uncharacterized protein LOC123717527 isoform X1 n=1 Tax=Pieris brassicae TaxID=7116 RepID=UPI001E6605C4|nr:uncharacterized protein LOC123717527 isoform X1 [Pieris brassicae]